MTDEVDTAHGHRRKALACARHHGCTPTVASSHSRQGQPPWVDPGANLLTADSIPRGQFCGDCVSAGEDHLDAVYLMVYILIHYNTSMVKKKSWRAVCGAAASLCGAGGHGRSSSVLYTSPRYPALVFIRRHLLHAYSWGRHTV